jgi:hypothetical protein
MGNGAVNADTAPILDSTLGSSSYDPPLYLSVSTVMSSAISAVEMN